MIRRGLPLDDITVLDLSLQLPGPYATMLLRSLGARVIKVEPPGGDLARAIDGPMFETLNAEKESLELDLRLPAGQAVLHRLAVACDVFIEGFRPGVTSRLGAGYDEIAALRPDVVYCSISGYGQRGPYRLLPGHDLNYLGVGGGVNDPRASPEDARPEQIGMPIVDLASGTNAALAIVAALRERDATGHGRYLDVAMLDAAVVWSNLKLPPPETAGEPAYGVFNAKDGLALTLAVIEDKFWRALCDVLGWSDWSADPSLADHASRKARASEIVTRLAASIALRTRAQWLAAFADAGVPAAPVQSGDEVLLDPQIAERGLFGPDRRLRAPLPSDLVRSPSGAAPARSAQAHTILAELDFDSRQRAELVRVGAVLAVEDPDDCTNGLAAARPVVGDAR